MDSHKPKVFVVNMSGHDYSAAERFGDLVFITRGPIDRYDTTAMYMAVVEAMKTSKPDDYILVTSLNALCGLACAVFARMHGKLNFLLYRKGTYIERRHDIDALI